MLIDKEKLALIEAGKLSLQNFFEIEKNIIKIGKSSILSAFQMIFELAPNTKSICWIQYTPYFNDGDTCVFSVGDIFFNAEKLPYGEDDDITAYYYGEGEMEQHYFSNFREKCKDSTLLISILDFIYTFFYESEFAKEVFGDHIAIYINAGDNDFTISEFEHD